MSLLSCTGCYNRRTLKRFDSKILQECFNAVFQSLLISLKLITSYQHTIKPGMETEMERNEIETACVQQLISEHFVLL